MTGAVIIDTDSDDSINVLRRRAQALHPGAVLEQMPVAHAHESNGDIENGNTLGTGLLRVLWLAPEARANGRSPCAHPMCAWMVEHAGDVLTKYLVGKDGNQRMRGSAGSPCTRRAWSLASSCGGARPGSRGATC